MFRDSVLFRPSEIVQKSFQMSETSLAKKDNLSKTIFQLLAYFYKQWKQSGPLSAGLASQKPSNLDLNYFQNRIYTAR